MRLNPGDKCVVLPAAQCSATPELGARLRGATVTLVSFVGVCDPASPFKRLWSIAETVCGYSDICIDESVLEKLPPPKREPLGKWADCPWQPGKEVIRKDRENSLDLVDC